MNSAFLPLKLLWRTWFMFVFVLTFLVLFPIFKVLLSRKAWFPYALFFKRVVAGNTCLLSGVFYRIIREEKTDWSRTYVIVSNHSSYLDIVLSYLFVPKYFLYMGKSELVRVPLFGIFYKRMNIPVDRASRKGAYEAYLRGCSALDEGSSLFIFPEATIPDHAPRLGHFRNGAARLAIDRQVAILPVTYLDNWKLFPEGKNAWKGGRPGLARIVLHRPVETNGLTEKDADALSARLCALTETTLREYGVV